MASIPQFFAQGTGFAASGGSASGFVIFPDDVLANDYAFLIANHNTSATMTYTSTYTFSLWFPFTAGLAWTNAKAYRHVCDGTEGGKTLSISFVAGALQMGAQIYVYRCADAGTWKHDLNGATTDTYLAVGQNAITLTHTCVGMSCSGNARLLFNIFITQDTSSNTRTVSGTTAWHMDAAMNVGAASYYEISASLTTSGSISNGRFAASISCKALVVATAIWVSVNAATQISLGAIGYGIGAAFGGAPIAIPFGA